MLVNLKNPNLVNCANIKLALTNLNKSISINTVLSPSQSSRRAFLKSSSSTNRCYTSLPILDKNNQSKNFLLVLGNKSLNFLNRTKFGKTYFQLVHSRNMSATAVNHKLKRVYDNIISSNQDKRKYRGCLLDNGMKCLLISDPTTDRSAAAVDVHTGYLLDPHEFPGLAHFCEHMLFMGSKKVNFDLFKFFLKKLNFAKFYKTLGVVSTRKHVFQVYRRSCWTH